MHDDMMVLSQPHGQQCVVSVMAASFTLLWELFVKIVVAGEEALVGSEDMWKYNMQEFRLHPDFQLEFYCKHGKIQPCMKILYNIVKGHNLQFINYKTLT